MRDDDMPLPQWLVTVMQRARTPAERTKAEEMAMQYRQHKRRQLDAVPAPDPVPTPAPAPAKKNPANPSKSKKHLVPKLPADWRQRVFAATETSRPASMLRKSVALLWITGCRPAEIEKGVSVYAQGQHLIVHITGAKVGIIDNGVTKSQRGIEGRKLKISANQNEASELLFKLANDAGGKILVKYDAVALSNKVSEAAKKALKKKGNGVSPYCYRHAMGSDLKSCDAIDDVTRAQVMGHLSVESLARYGRRRRGGGGPSPVQAVRTTAQPRGERSTAPQQTEQTREKMRGG